MVNQLNLKGQRFVALAVSAVWISKCCHMLVVQILVFIFEFYTITLNILSIFVMQILV